MTSTVIRLPGAGLTPGTSQPVSAPATKAGRRSPAPADLLISPQTGAAEPLSLGLPEASTGLWASLLASVQAARATRQARLGDAAVAHDVVMDVTVMVSVLLVMATAVGLGLLELGVHFAVLP